MFQLPTAAHQTTPNLNGLKNIYLFTNLQLGQGSVEVARVCSTGNQLGWLEDGELGSSEGSLTHMSTVDAGSQLGLGPGHP